MGLETFKNCLLLQNKPFKNIFDDLGGKKASSES